MRSLLFVPGSSERMILKAEACDADALIFDLEDAVRSADKGQARDLVAAHLRRRKDNGKKIVVRVNDLLSSFCQEDVRAIVPSCPDFLMLPKSREPKDVRRLADMMEAAGNGGKCSILVVATETVTSTASLLTSSWAHPLLKGLLWGAEDLSTDCGALSSRDEQGRYSEPFRMARNFCLFGARLAGVQAIDAVYTNFRDPDGLKAEASAARRDGFTAKAAIHPDQVAVINELFTPQDQEINWAHDIVEALDKSATGIAEVGGEMVDAPHLARARLILSAAGILDC